MFTSIYDTYMIYVYLKPNVLVSNKKSCYITVSLLFIKCVLIDVFKLYLLK